MELYEMEERLKQAQQRALQQQEVVHKQEVNALSQEWNSERKVMDYKICILNLLSIYICVVYSSVLKNL
jgi:hypothetical protein